MADDVDGAEATAEVSKVLRKGEKDERANSS